MKNEDVIMKNEDIDRIINNSGRAYDLVNFLKSSPGVFPQKLAAVKLVKEITGLGLKESKDYVDNFDIKQLSILNRADKINKLHKINMIDEIIAKILEGDLESNMRKGLIVLDKSELSEILESLDYKF